MSTEILKPEFGADQHPDENQLLLALERELSPEETAEIERHIGICWNCRARYHEIQSGILAFIEYREKLYLPALDSVPRDFRGFPFLLNNTATESPQPGLLDRVRNRIRGFLSSFSRIPIQVRWIGASAAIMIAALLWTQVINPSAISASELLVKAAQTQNPPVKNRKVRQKVRVKTAKSEIVREFEWATGSPIPQANWDAQADLENWTAPLTAEGFIHWHDSLTDPKDKVTRSGDHWTLETTAASGLIKDASIAMRDGDFHPTEQHIRFSDDRSLDLEEVSFEMERETSGSVASPPVARSVEAPVTLNSPETAPPPTINLDEAELELRYVIFTQHWDQDEDLQIERTDGAVVLSGTVSSTERARQMQAAIANLPGVRLSIGAPDAERATAARPAPQKSTARSTSPLLKDPLDHAFASASARRDFVDDCVSASDSALSHAWALKKLVERYADADRVVLKSESQLKLEEMLRGHLQQLASANTTLNGVLDLLPSSRPARAEIPADWRSGVLALFDLVQQQDSLVAALVVGTQTNNQTVAVASDQFRSAHEAIRRLASELRPPENTVK
jgi:hypothetical protein